MRQCAELLRARDEIGLTVDLNHHADTSAAMGVHLDHAVGRLSIGSIGCRDHALLAQPFDSLLKVPIRFLQGLSAIEHACVGLGAKRLDHVGSDLHLGVLAHAAPASVLESSDFSEGCSGAGTAAASVGAAGATSIGASVAAFSTTISSGLRVALSLARVDSPSSAPSSSSSSLSTTLVVL